MRAPGRGALLLLGIVLVAVFAALYVALRPDPVMRVTLRIHPLLGGEPLALGQGRYANPGGEGAFTIRDFQFFLSNVRLAAPDGDYREPGSYHLVRFDGEDGLYHIDLEAVPRREYDRISFGIGVDSAANNSIEAVGDLDPNGRMAWGWDIGYKFVLVEGRLEVVEAVVPLVYHVGFDDNYLTRSLPLDASAFNSESATIDLCADLLRMFTSVETIDLQEIPSVTFDDDQSRLLAGNWASMVTDCPAETRVAAR